MLAASLVEAKASDLTLSIAIRTRGASRTEAVHGDGVVLHASSASIAISAATRKHRLNLKSLSR